MTATLEVNYVRWTIFAADPTDTTFLDREFLSAGGDESLSRAPFAPCLRFRSGSWWIDNDTDRNAIAVVVFEKELGRITVDRRLSLALPDGDIDVYINDYSVSLRVSGSDPFHTRPGPTRMIGSTTQIGLAEADANVRELFSAKSHTRTILAAMFSQHLTSGADSAQSLSRGDAQRCMNLKSPNPIDAALQDVQKAIWGELGKDRGEVARFLINHRLLEAKHMVLIPHGDCGHRKA